MKKLKVLLVDDESIVIQDLLTLINWEENGFNIVGWAYNAESAINLAEKYKPDIVFMDVALPASDGLELSEKIKKTTPSVTIVVLSGYMNFSYAQRAIDIGIFTYLVKHELTPQKLLEVLNKIREKKTNTEEETLLIRHQILSNCLQKNTPVEQLIKLKESYLLPYQKQLTLILMTPVIPFLLREKKKIDLSLHYLYDAFSSEEPENRTVDFIIDKNNLAIITNIGSTCQSQKNYLATVLNFIQEVQNKLFEMTGEKYFAVLLPHCTKLENIKKDFLLLQSHLPHYLFSESQVEIVTSKTVYNTDENTSFINRDNFLNSYKDIIDKISEAFQKACTTRNYHLFSKLVKQIILLLTEFNIDIYSESAEISKLATAESVSRYLLNQLNQLHDSVEAERGYSPITGYVLQYIKENYNRNPSIMKVSKILNGNHMYIGRKFKEETGKSFREYLSEYRINEVKKLLSGTSLSINKIAKRVGISNSQYLCKLFKDMTGETPANFRNKYLKIK